MDWAGGFTLGTVSTHTDYATVGRFEFTVIQAVRQRMRLGKVQMSGDGYSPL
jgi:hypothetical protein